MFKFEELNVYKESLDFVEMVYKLTDKWPKTDLFGLTNQFRRASVSVSLNIAEGSSRTKKDFCHFLDMARGSVYECVAILAIAKGNNYIDESEYNQFYENGEKMARMISALKRSIR